jgi:glutaredoxin
VGSTRSVQLYYAQGCHLCESARRVLERVRAQVPFDLEEIDIGGDPELEPRYRERLPVDVIDGEEVFSYYVHPDALRRRVAG